MTFTRRIAVYTLYAVLFLNCDMAKYKSTDQTIHDQITFSGTVKNITYDVFTDSLFIDMPILLPISIGTKGDTCLLYDYNDGLIKGFDLNESFFHFNPGGSYNNPLGGVFQYAGFGPESSELLISSTRGIKSYNLITKSYGDLLVELEECESINTPYAEIITTKTSNNKYYMFSQHGIPCIFNKENIKSITTESFKDIRFLMSYDMQNGSIKYTGKIPPKSPFIQKKQLHGSVSPFYSYNHSKKVMYGIIEPIPEIYEYNIDNNGVLQLRRTLSLKLPKTNFPIPYFIGKNMQNLSEQHFDNNFQIHSLRSVDEYIVLVYSPSQEPDQPIDTRKYAHHYFIAIIDTQTGQSYVLAKDYEMYYYLGFLDTQDLVFYDLHSSESLNSSNSMIRLVNIQTVMDKM